MFCWSLVNTHRLGRSPDTEPRLSFTVETRGRERLSLPGGFCGWCRQPDGGSADGWKQFRCWSTLAETVLGYICYLTVHWPLSLCLLSALIISQLIGWHYVVLLLCSPWLCTPGLYLAAVRFRLSWDSLEAAERRGGQWVPGLTRPQRDNTGPGVNSGHHQQ